MAPSDERKKAVSAGSFLSWNTTYVSTKLCWNPPQIHWESGSTKFYCFIDLEHHSLDNPHQRILHKFISALPSCKRFKVAKNQLTTKAQRCSFLLWNTSLPKNWWSHYKYLSKFWDIYIYIFTYLEPNWPLFWFGKDLFWGVDLQK